MIGRTGKICFFRLPEDADLIDAIKKKAEENSIKTGTLALIGTLKNAVVGFYRSGKYDYIHLNGPLEIASCTGNIAVDEKGEVIVHAHIVVTNEKAEALGGHLMKGSHIGVTAELTIVEGAGVNLQRAFDEKTKLNLLRMD